MLWHLVKYDLKFIYKQLIIFYIIVLGCAVLARLTNFFDAPFWVQLVHGIAQGTAIGFSFGAFINASIRTWARFRSNLYGDKSYLTHTLPISKATLYASKFITNVIVMGISVLVIVAAAAILFLTPDILKQLNLAQAQYNFNFWYCAAVFIAMVFLQFVFIMQAGCTGILLGHRANNRRLLWSNVIGLAIYLLGGTLMIVYHLIWAQNDPSMAKILLYGQFDNVDYLYRLFYSIGFSYLILIAATYFTDYKLLKRGVNVD